MAKELIIISVGGSLIVPDKIDVNFLKKFRALIIKNVSRGKKFVIICGGGKTSRRYQNSARSVGVLTKWDVDWLGIHATRINGHLMRTIFYKIAHPRMIEDPTEKINFKEKVLIVAGWKPGFSTDHVAVHIAKNLKAKKLVNLTNIDYVYDKDPSKFKNASPIKQISWKRFRSMFQTDWDPGLNSPFDPVASKEAQKQKMEVAILNGNSMKNLEKFLAGKDFVGTRIL